MSSERLVASQAIVTDPGGTAASGYTLVGCSRGVVAEEADFLRSMPGVSQYLTTEDVTASFYSFHSLPSRRYALTRRFVRGRRRQKFNRVVAHSLVLSREDLSRIETQAWLLSSHCRMRPEFEAGRWMTFVELGDALPDPFPRKLPDLAIELVQDPSAAARGMVEEWRVHLLRALGADGLRERIEWVLAHLEAGKRLLVEQDLEWELLLALAWSSLTEADRLCAPWTTHFAPGSRVQFRLGSAPAPASARRSQREPSEWSLPGDTLQPAPRPGAASLLASLVADGDWESVTQLWNDARGVDPSLGLLTEPGRLARYLRWLRVARQLESGRDFASVSELAQEFEAALRPDTGGPEPWVEQAKEITAWIGRAVASLVRRASLPESVLNHVVNWLREKRLEPLVCDVRRIARLDAGNAAPEDRIVARVLASRCLRPPPEAAKEREDLLDQWPTEGDPAPVLDEPFAWLAEDTRALLSLELARCRSTRVDELTAWLAQSPRGLEIAEDRLRQGSPHWEPALLLASRVPAADTARFDRVGIDLLHPLLVAEPSRADALPQVVRERLVGAQRRHPQQHGEALAALPPSLSAPLFAALREELAGEPSLGCEVARAVVRKNGGVKAVARAHDVRGLTALLRNAGAEAPLWVPFAASEACRMDAKDEASGGALAAEIREAQVSERDAIALCGPVMSTLHDAAREGAVGACLRALAGLVVAGVGAAPVAAAKALRTVLLRPDVDASAWTRIVAQAIHRLEAAGATECASVLRQDISQASARSQVDRVPPELLELIRGADRTDVAKIVTTWTSRLATLPGGEARRVYEALSEAARDDVGIQGEVELAALLADLECGRRRLPGVLRSIGKFAAEHLASEEQLEHWVRRSLEAAGARDAKRALELLFPEQGTAPLRQAVARVIESRILPELIRSQGTPAWPEFRRVMRRPAVLDLMIQDATDRFPDTPGPLHELCALALQNRCYEVVAACLDRTDRLSFGGHPLARSLETAHREGLVCEIVRAADTPAGRRHLPPLTPRLRPRWRNPREVSSLR